MKLPAAMTNPLRPAILAAAGSSRVRRVVTGAPVTRRLVERFVAGETRVDALAVARRILASGRAVSIDFLGEDTTDAAQATATVDEYLALIAELGELPEAATTQHLLEVSLKLSAVGQALGSGGADLSTANARAVCAAAESAGIWVTVDAEDHTTTDRTLGTVRELRGEFPWLGAALQSHLRRTQADCRELADSGTRIRLCKGAYREPESVAFVDRRAVDASYLRCLEILMDGSGYPMVASHDPAMITAMGSSAARSGRRADAFEYQMLYGIREQEQLRLTREGKQVRVYLPYGDQWYGYFMRRLAERPSNLRFFLRSLVTRD